MQVPSGAERRLARAGDDEDEGALVVAEPLPRVVQLRVHLSVDRVVLIRTVVGQRYDVRLLVVAKRLVIHRFSPRLGSSASQLARGGRPLQHRANDDPPPRAPLARSRASMLTSEPKWW